VIRIVLGIVGILMSTGVVLLGAGFLSVESTIGALDPAARASIPGTVRFDADDRDYTIAFNSRRPVTLVNDARCTITHPDESVTRIRGDRQKVSLAGETIGEFEGRGGSTTVECTFVERDLDNVAARIVITPQREWIRVVGFLFIGAGVVGILSSVALILFGLRARTSR
jgi:hypothetical protein